MEFSGNKRTYFVEPRDQHGIEMWKIVIKFKRKDKINQNIGFYPSKACDGEDIPLLFPHCI
jgi:hypothetical protein